MNRSTSLARGILTTILLAGVCAALAAPAFYASSAPASQLAASPSGVVISEFRARGPDGGADELIELYNSSPDPVDISGWSLWQSNATGGPPNSLKDADGNAAFPAGTILRPGQHFLAANDNAYNGAVQADWAYTTGQITNNGGIALKNAAGQIEDATGMSDQVFTGYVEGTPLSPLPTPDEDQSYERKPLGGDNDCTDTNDNAADFLRIVPSDPQNTSSDLWLCGIKVQGTTTTIQDPAPGAAVGQPVTVSFAVIVNPPGSGTPDGGTVTVKSGADSCSGPLNNGQGSCALVFSTVGAKSITASYGGHA
ncbi:MAG TPA: lamin tail domain-containing protein, partial [Geobacteraceae bacterium]